MQRRHNPISTEFGNMTDFPASQLEEEDLPFPFDDDQGEDGGVWTLPPAIAGYDIEQIVLDINKFTANHGYAVSRKRSDVPFYVIDSTGAEKKHYAQTTLQCVYGSVYKDTSKNINKSGNSVSRNLTTIKTDCQFVLKIKRVRATLQWKPYEVVCDVHNHTKAGPGALAAHRHLTPLDRARAIDLLSNHHSASTVIEILRAEKDALGEDFIVTRQDLVNLGVEAKAGWLMGENSTQALLDHLRFTNTPFDHWMDDERHLEGLLIVNPMGLALARAYGHVLFMDCTYKTNKYRMPLLHIVSSASTNHSYTIAYGWLRTETTAQYTRALTAFKHLIGPKGIPTSVVVTDHEVALINALMEVFPSWIRLLCRWRITGNIVAKGRNKTPDELWKPFILRWKELTQSPTEEILEARIRAMEDDYGQDPDAPLFYAWNYCKDKLQNRKFFVACYTDQYMTFGEVNTSRVEGSHAAMKKRVKSATGDLLHVTAAISRYAAGKEREILERINFEKTHRTVRQGKLFDDVSDTKSLHEGCVRSCSNKMSLGTMLRGAALFC